MSCVVSPRHFQQSVHRLMSHRGLLGLPENLSRIPTSLEDGTTRKPRRATERFTVRQYG